MIITKIFIGLLCLSVFSCGEEKNLLTDHRAGTNAAVKVVPYVKEIKKDFDSVVYLANFKIAEAELQAIFFIDGWFECTLVQAVHLSEDSVKPKDGCLLYILEVTSITKTSSGQTMRSYGNQTILKGKQIQEFIDSKYDLEKLGFKKRTDLPPEDMLKRHQEMYPGY